MLVEIEKIILPEGLVIIQVKRKIFLEICSPDKQDFVFKVGAIYYWVSENCGLCLIGS